MTNKNWTNVMRLNCQTSKLVNIKSYGDWEFVLKRISTKDFDSTVEQYLKEQKKEQFNCCYQRDENDEHDPNCQCLQVNAIVYDQIDNISDGLERISVEINISKEQFKTLYGFWKISNFKVYDQDGNSSKISFSADDETYIGYYWTS